MLAKDFKKIYIIQIIILAISFVSYLFLGFVFQSRPQKVSSSSNITFILDLSDSMNVQDSTSSSSIPISRLKLAKNLIQNNIDKSNFQSYGLITFTQRGYFYIPPTQDLNHFQIYLKNLNTSSIPIGWSNIYQAIDKFSQTAPKWSLGVILSDFGNNQDFTDQKQKFDKKLLKRLKQKNTKLLALGLGKTTPGSIKSSNWEYLQKNGKVLKDSLNKKYLNFISKKLNIPSQQLNNLSTQNLNLSKYQMNNQLTIQSNQIKNYEKYLYFFSLLGL